MDAAQSRLTAFFGSKPKEAPPAAGTSSSVSGGRSAVKREKVAARGVKRKVKVESENDREEQGDSLMMIPVCAKRNNTVYGSSLRNPTLSKTTVLLYLAATRYFSRVSCLAGYYTVVLLPAG